MNNALNFLSSLALSVNVALFFRPEVAVSCASNLFIKWPYKNRNFRIEPFAGGLLEGEDDENWTDGDDDENDGDDGGLGEEDVEFSDGEKFMFNNTEIQDFS